MQRYLTSLRHSWAFGMMVRCLGLLLVALLFRFGKGFLDLFGRRDDRHLCGIEAVEDLVWNFQRNLGRVCTKVKEVSSRCGLFVMTM